MKTGVSLKYLSMNGGMGMQIHHGRQINSFPSVVETGALHNRK